MSAGVNQSKAVAWMKRRPSLFERAVMPRGAVTGRRRWWMSAYGEPGADRRNGHRRFHSQFITVGQVRGPRWTNSPNQPDARSLDATVACCGSDSANLLSA